MCCRTWQARWQQLPGLLWSGVAVHSKVCQEQVGNELANVEGHGPVECELAIDHLHAWHTTETSDALTTRL